MALWLPFLPADRLRAEGGAAAAGFREGRPLVIVEKVRGALRLFAADRRGHGLGLTRGLSLADARARIPDLAVAEADPAADAAFLERLAADCERFTPLAACDAPDGLMLDIAGCAHLFGGEEELVGRVRGRLARAGIGTRAAIAGTPDAAWALARFGAEAVTIAAPGQEAAQVRPLPVVALRIASDIALGLSRAGLTRVADLADRPSSVLAARFGEGLLTRLRRTLGLEDARIIPLRPPPDCMAERHFPEPMAHLPGIEAVLAQLAAEAGRMLERRGAGGRAFELGFFRSDGKVRRLAVETGRPTRDPAAILRLFRERMEALADPLDPGFGFDAVRLSVPVAEPFAVLQPGLDGRAAEEIAVTELVDRLVARFGAGRVLRFSGRDSHQPERAAALVPATAAPASDAIWPAPEPDEPPARPLHLFDPPQPIETLAEVPDGPPLRFRWRRVLHEIARAEGPERIAPDWWRDGPQPPTRDYYRVEDAEGRRFWVFRQGLYEATAEPPRWFLHGLFA